MNASQPLDPSSPEDPFLRALFPNVVVPGAHWGLGKTRELLARAGNPHLAYPVLHVAGTNGKGSVVATWAAVLQAHGLEVGMYTSPHLVRFNERVRIDGHPLPDQDLLAAAARLHGAMHELSPSFFESATVLAFSLFAERAVDVAVVEVGLGGRLDSTNVVEPTVTAITNVSLDHVEYLGHTLTEIAFEKAGIVKPGVPLVTGESDADALAVVRGVARDRGAPLDEVTLALAEDLSIDARGTRFRTHTETWGELVVETPLVGRHQALNALVALRALERLPDGLRPDRDAVVSGMRRVSWPGRMQRAVIDGRTWIFDAAHNAAGVEALLEALPALNAEPPLTALVGILDDKDWLGMLVPITRRAQSVVLTVPTSAPPHRRWDPAAAAQALMAEVPGARVLVRPDFDEALQQVSETRRGSVLVAGSFHTVGDALARLGVPSE